MYEYRCDACSHEFETLQKISDEPLKHCPSCEEPKLRKLVSAAGFRLKGDGWYETDFKSGSKKNLAESSSAKKPNAAACGTGCGCH
jgi:putative FmdB family regulatory protein